MNPRWISTPIVETVTPPAQPLLSAAEIRTALRIEATDEDSFLDALAAVAADHLDGWTGILRRALVTRDVSLKVCGPDCDGRLFAPLSPAQELIGIEYFAPDATSLTALDIDDFRMIAAPDWAYIEPKPGIAWPAFDDRPDALQAVFRCGYGTPDQVPPAIRHAARLIIGHLYENREETTLLRLESLPFGVTALIYPHKLGFAA